MQEETKEFKITIADIFLYIIKELSQLLPAIFLICYYSVSKLFSLNVPFIVWIISYSVALLIAQYTRALASTISDEDGNMHLLFSRLQFVTVTIKANYGLPIIFYMLIFTALPLLFVIYPVCNIDLMLNFFFAVLLVLQGYYLARRNYICRSLAESTS